MLAFVLLSVFAAVLVAGAITAAIYKQLWLATLVVAILMLDLVYGIPWAYSGELEAQWGAPTKRFFAWVSLYGPRILWITVAILSLITVVLAFTKFVSFSWDGLTTTNPATQVWPGVAGTAMLIVAIVFIAAQFGAHPLPEIELLHETASELSAIDTEVKTTLYPVFTIELPAKYMKNQAEQQKWLDRVKEEAAGKGLTLEPETLISIRPESDREIRRIIRTTVTYKLKSGEIKNWSVYNGKDEKATAKWAREQQEMLQQFLPTPTGTTTVKDEKKPGFDLPETTPNGTPAGKK